MFRNYFTIGWRTLVRHKGYALMNVLGLALGLCSCIVIYLIVHYELGFDNFHPDGQRIYRVTTTFRENNGNRLPFGTVPFPAVQLLQAGLPGAETVAAAQPWWGVPVNIPVSNKPDRKFDSRTEGGGYSRVAIAQRSWFSLFHYEWLAGNVSAEPFTVVLTESKARQYFGAVPVGAMLGNLVVYDSLAMRVSGIVKDWDPSSDIPFTDLISYSTLQSNYFASGFDQHSWRPDGQLLLTFIKLRKGSNPGTATAQLASMIKGQVDPQLRVSLGLDPLKNLHFNADLIENPIRTAHIPTLYALMGIALFILLIAAINFINLSTAQSLQRAKEVGVRKVLGSSRTSLVLQFLTETFVLSLLAVGLAVLLVKPVLSSFRSFLPPGLSVHFMDPSLLLFAFGMTLVTTLLAGLYPAKQLSGYLPSLTLKGSGAVRGGGKWYLRKGLIVLQFTISLVFIIGSIVIAGQMSYARHADLGFRSDAIITIPTPGSDSISNTRVTAEAIRRLSGVRQVALQWAGPGNPAGMNIKIGSIGSKEIRTGQVDGDENLIPLYQIRLVAGRNLEHADRVNEFVINESLARVMGCKKPEEAIGRTIYWFDRPYPVVGVVADFHSGSLHNPIGPLCIINRVERERTLVVKLAANGKGSDAMKRMLARMEATWKTVYPGQGFSYQFYEETLAMAYQKDQQVGTLMNTATGITIFISCLGLFGLAMFTAEKRTREIGIRKVMGASATSIAMLLTKEFVPLIVLAALVATPVAWYFMNGWLNGFACRITLSWWIFVAGGLAALFLAAAAVSYHAAKAALQNPVKSLRTE